MRVLDQTKSECNPIHVTSYQEADPDFDEMYFESEFQKCPDFPKFQSTGVKPQSRTQARERVLKLVCEEGQTASLLI
jgi:hypothetical protein